jgi:L-ribulose-5-phosphate 3-epimerase UlaE
MNHVGALIWELLEERGLDMDSLCLAVHERFPDEAIDQIRSDVADLLKELEQNGLTTAVKHSSAA